MGFMNALEEFEIYSAYANPRSRDIVLNDHLNFVANRLYDIALSLLAGATIR